MKDISMEISDNQIVELVIQGETEAYGELVLRYQKIIYNLMYRICLSAEDAAELTQEAFCAAYEKLGTFNREKKFFPWLYTLAMNRGRDWRRKRNKASQGMQQYRMEMTLLAAPVEIDAIEQEQEYTKLLNALSTLPEETREMVLLRYKNDISMGELSEIFGLSQSGVKMRIHRALQTLQRNLENQ